MAIETQAQQLRNRPPADKGKSASPRQAQCLRLIVASLRDEGRMPTFATLCRGLGGVAHNTVTGLLGALARKGYLQIESRTSRGITLAGVRLQLVILDTPEGRRLREALGEGGVMVHVSLRLGEKIWIGEDIWITVVDIRRDQVKLGTQAPLEVPIFRSELLPLRPTPPEGKADAAPQ